VLHSHAVIDSHDRTGKVENAAKRILHLVARGGEHQKSGDAQSSGSPPEDLRARLAAVTASDDVLFASESDWPTSDLSLQRSAAAEGEMPVELVNDEAPLFLDEPADLPKVAPRDTSHLDGLFADEREIAAAATGTANLPAGWRAADAQGPRSVGRPRTAMLVAVILAGSLAGFALAYALLT
jgi:hypothetical protein